MGSPVVSLGVLPPHPRSQLIPRLPWLVALPVRRLRVSLPCGAARLPMYPPMGSLAVLPPVQIPTTPLPLPSLPMFLILSWHGADISPHRSIGARDILLPRSAAHRITW